MRIQPAHSCSSEGDSNSQLNLSCTKRRSNLSERAIKKIVVDCAKIDTVRRIQKIEPELQVPLFAQQGNLVVLKHTGIYLDQARVAIDISGQVTFLPSRNRKVRRREDAISKGFPAVRACEIATGFTRNVVEVPVVVVVATCGTGTYHPKRSSGLHHCNTGQFPSGRDDSTHATFQPGERVRPREREALPHVVVRIRIVRGVGVLVRNILTSILVKTRARFDVTSCMGKRIRGLEI